MAEGHVDKPPSKRRLLWLSLIGLGVGTFVALCFILPAEFRTDPTGFGKATGLDKLAGPKEVQVAAPSGPSSGAPTTSTVYRTDVIEIALASAEEFHGSELEYKVRMKNGDALVYSWDVQPVPPPTEFYYDLHSQSDPQPDVKVVSFKQATESAQRGFLIAPFDGIHGWYLQNQSLKPVKVRLQLAGFYQLVSAEDLAAAEAAAAGVEATGPGVQEEQGAEEPK